MGVGWGFDTREVQSLRPLGQNYRKIPLFIKFHGSCVLTLPCTIINGVLMYMCNNCTLSMIKCPSHPLLGQIPHPLGRNMRQWLWNARPSPLWGVVGLDIDRCITNDGSACMHALIRCIHPPLPQVVVSGRWSYYCHWIWWWSDIADNYYQFALPSSGRLSTGTPISECFFG